ncbi:MAG: polymerase [Spirochaetaceae bacterium]|nr:polymerase [Spirochaetaceae bacterium]
MYTKFMYISSLYILMCMPSLAYAIPLEARISGAMDWESLKINAAISVDVKDSGLPLPSGRGLMEDALAASFYAKIEPFILSIPVDSSTVLGDWVNRGDLSPAVVDALAGGAGRVPTVFSRDFTVMSASYRIDLADVSQKLIRHTRSVDIRTALQPVESPAYTGILIIASEELPFHGHRSNRFLVPCLFPRIWDTDMNLIYEKNMVNQNVFKTDTMIRYTKSDNIFQKSPSGISPEVEKIIGNKPLRIIARGVFGISATDPIIDTNDALQIISSESNRRLLREGKVVIVLSDSVLVKNISDK